MITYLKELLQLTIKIFILVIVAVVSFDLALRLVDYIRIFMI